MYSIRAFPRLQSDLSPHCDNPGALRAPSRREAWHSHHRIRKRSKFPSATQALTKGSSPTTRNATCFWCRLLVGCFWETGFEIRQPWRGFVAPALRINDPAPPFVLLWINDAPGRMLRSFTARRPRTRACWCRTMPRRRPAPAGRSTSCRRRRRRQTLSVAGTVSGGPARTVTTEGP